MKRTASTIIPMGEDECPPLMKSQKEPALDLDFIVGGMDVNWKMLYDRRVYGIVQGEEGLSPVKRQFFPNQEPAIEHWERNGCRGVVYSRDIPYGNGAKRYVVDTIENHTRTMNRTSQDLRNYYEMCSGERFEDGFGAVHMHIDTDAAFSPNKERFANLEAWEEIETHYLEYFIAYMCKNLRIEREMVSYYILDSSRDEGDKLSRHYTIRIHGAMFASNFDCGALKRHFQKHIHEKYGAPDAPGSGNVWYFRHKNGARVFDFWLDSIYTVHRQFRMFGNTKHGQKRPLLHAKGFKNTAACYYSFITPDQAPEDGDGEELLHLFRIPEVEGGPSRSRAVPASHFMHERVPKRRSGTQTKRQLPNIEQASVFASNGVDELCAPENLSSEPSLIWEKGGAWATRGRRNGRTRKPRVCVKFGEALCEWLLACHDKRGVVKPYTAPVLESTCPLSSSFRVQYSDFLIPDRFVFVTAGKHCGVLWEQKKGKRSTHSQQKSILVVDIKTRTFWWECFSAHECNGRRSQVFSLETESFDQFLGEEKARNVMTGRRKLRVFFDLFDAIGRLFDFKVDTADVISNVEFLFLKEW